MLIRVGGGKGGIKEYLKHAIKQGRSMGRDQLDERVVLAGDLDLTHAVIENMTSTGEKYLHVTLACKEDFIHRSTLDVLVKGFEEFALCAYEQREYCYYAEAHLPRIKSYLDAQTGETVVRKPHIHIVIPKVNLLSGRYLNPLGMVRRNVRYIDAFQESMNVSLGLASPKKNHRVDFAGESEMIARYSGEGFSGTGKDLKAQILRAMLLESVQSNDGFKVLLARVGEVRTRNDGGGSEYQNIKIAGAKKGVNLKEYVFGREFVELSVDDKRKFLKCKTDLTLSYDMAGSTAVPPMVLVDTLREWRNIRAREVRWLNSGKRKEWRQYHEMDHEGRCRWLDERSKRFYARYNLEDVEDSVECLDPKVGTTGSVAIGDMPCPNPIAGVQPSKKRPPATGRAADNVVSQFARDAREHQHVESVSMDFAEIKAQLDPQRLLADLSQSHGLVVEKYHVVRIADGSKRIDCGARRLNVSDFLTKELRLAWTEASKVLQESYASQQRGDLEPAPMQEPRRSLWLEFGAERKLRTQRIRASDREVRRLGAENRSQLKEAFRARVRLVRVDRSLSPAQRKKWLLEIRTERLAREAELRLRVLSDRTQLKETRSVREQYRDFLLKQAQAGDEPALPELRRQRPNRLVFDRATFGELTSTTQRNSVICEAEGVTFRVAADGSVTYEQGGQPILCDTDGALVLLRGDEATVRTALVFASRIFGNALTVCGSVHLFQQVVRMAGSNMRIEFEGPSRGAVLPLAADVSNRPFVAPGEHPLDAHVPDVSYVEDNQPGSDEQGVGQTAGDEMDELKIEALLDLLVRLTAVLPNGDPRREDWWSLETIDEAHLMDIPPDDPWTQVHQFLRQHLDVALAMDREMTKRLPELEDLEQFDNLSPHA